MSLTDAELVIRPYSPEDEAAVIDLWEKCNLTRPSNNAGLDIERKLKDSPELFLVGITGGRLMATVMGGYEGHRGWINYLAVDPEHQKLGLGRQMMGAIEEKLLETGCPKINLQVRGDNTEVIRFYEHIGYNTEDRVSMAKRLIED